ncbi:putative RNA 3'-terminal phosphate cyclase-like protein [Trichinella zimbabwensis]|uniref:Putative RNA 3'-terminal phosphate cyclase-like protein n=1 Tax=Trichinella zimbabwensis TaxID=268475 RepID=A0A0V1HJI6_9BILA|nr:putative RNA 3'-terminal phosphate cyclase-like protein [Trichinella zimbabwensis]
MEKDSVLQYEGCNFLRQRLVLATLSGRPVRIVNIRPDDVSPGVTDFEIKLFNLLSEITNRSTVDISPSGTTVFYKPGSLVGGKVEMDMGVVRGLGYYLEVLCFLAPFVKSPLNVRLRGVTNGSGEPSVDLIKYAWLPVMRRFMFDTEGLDLKIVKRGLNPNGNGEILFTCPISRQLRPVQIENMGKVRKVRGVAYSCRISPALANRCIESAKASVKHFLNDVYFHTDHRKGLEAGSSPGFGIILSAETTEGIYFVSEKHSNPLNSGLDPSVPEDIGTEAAERLFSEIYRGGCCDATAQTIATLFMALGPKDVSKFVLGPLSTYCVHFLRHMKDFLGIVFKIESYDPLKGKSAEDQKLEIGCRDKVKLDMRKEHALSASCFLRRDSSCFLQQLSAILSETPFTTLWANIAKSLENSRCFWYECCLETHVKFNITGLEKSLNQRLYGQHLVSRTVLPALKAHFSSTTSKALVLSFHGWTGGGKNYVSQFIAESIYKYGMKSTFVRYFIGGYHFPDRKLVDVYKQQLREWIKGNVSTCQYSLFIFDEVDRMPPGVLDAIKPFLEYTQMVDGVDFTKSIFIFLSNVGGSDIAKYVYDVWKQGLPRESITLQDLESIMYPVIFNENSGFQFSELISNHLIDHFVPFLPLERVHVKSCVYDQLKRRSVQLDATTIDEILKTITYFPNEAQIFSSSGCKRIAQKVELFIVDVLGNDEL